MKDILEVKKLLRGNRGPAAIAVGLLFLAMVTAAVSAASDITDMPDTLKVDPLNGAWKSRVLPHQVRGDEDILRHTLKGADTVERLGKRHRFVRHDALGDGGGEYIIVTVTSAEFRTGACALGSNGL